MDKSEMKRVALKYPSEVLRPYDAIMEVGGFDSVCAFTDHLGGLTVYVPATRTIFMRCIEAEIKSEFNGYNLQALSRKYGLTERHLRRIVKE